MLLHTQDEATVGIRVYWQLQAIPQVMAITTSVFHALFQTSWPGSTCMHVNIDIWSYRAQVQQTKRTSKFDIYYVMVEARFIAKHDLFWLLWTFNNLHIVLWCKYHWSFEFFNMLDISTCMGLFKIKLNLITFFKNHVYTLATFFKNKIKWVLKMEESPKYPVCMVVYQLEHG